MEPNSYFVKISGKANIPEPLELGNGYKIVLEGEITASSDFSLQNGTFDRTFTYRPALATVEDDKGRVIKAKDLRSWSSKLRRTLYHVWEGENDETITHEEHYERFMKYLFSKVYDLAEEAKKTNRQ